MKITSHFGKACIPSLMFLAFSFLVGSQNVHAFTQITASPASINFGSVPLGFASSQMVVIQNQGFESIPFVNVVSAGDMSNFQHSGSCSYLMPFSSCMLEVRFVPVAEGMHTTTFLVQAGSTSTSIFVQGEVRPKLEGSE